MTNNEETKECREALALDIIEHLGPVALAGGKMSVLEAFEKGWQAAWNRRAQVAGWQPIATAPKDVEILLCSPRIGAVRGRWNEDKYASKPRPYWTNDMEHIFGVRATRENQPTFWQPLPVAPERSE